MTDTGPIVERVMRMGLEHRAGVQLERLWDVAVAQLKAEKRASEIHGSPSWWTQPARYAMIRTAGVLSVIRIKDETRVRIVRWVSPTMPEVQLT